MQNLTLTKKIQKILALLILIILIMSMVLPNYIYATELTDFLYDTYGSILPGLLVERNGQNIIDAIKSVNGVKDVKIEDGKLTVETDSSQIERIRADIQQAFVGNTIVPEDLISIITAEFNMAIKQTTTSSSTGENTQPKSEREQFNEWLGSRYTLSSQTLDLYWEYYQDGREGITGEKTVDVTKDANGNITNIRLNLDSEQQNATGTSQEAAGQIQEAQKEERGEEDGTFGLLLSPFTSLLVGVADAVNYVLQSALIGDDSIKVTMKIDDAGSYIAANPPMGGLPVVEVVEEGVDHSAGLFWSTYKIGTIRLTPAEIFAGRVSALNANFFKSSTDSDMLGGEEKSIVSDLKSVVSSWYLAIRNIAIVGLLSVLLYIGIRIIISSSANDKAKYKQFFEDWLIALCLIFFMHYIMSFTMTISEQVTNMLSNAGQSVNSDGSIRQCVIQLDNGKSWSSNFTNVARVKAQYDGLVQKLGYTVLYVGLTAYTVYFTVIYLKRVLMLAFYTLMAPAVALTYPLDKMKDGKAQAFNYWLKDYIFYALLQPLHMILYTVFVSSALDLAANNMIYAIVAFAFIIPAEKIIKQMFGIKGNTEDRVGGFMGGALAGSMFSNLKKMPKQSQGGNGKEGGANTNANKIPTFKNENAPDTFDIMAQEAIKLPQDERPQDNEESQEEKAKAAAATAAGFAAGAAASRAAETTENDNQENSQPQPQNAEYDSRLTPEQMEALNAQGIKPGTPEYEQYLAEHGLGNGDKGKGIPMKDIAKQKRKQESERLRKIASTAKGYSGKVGRFKRYVNNKVTDAGGWGHIAAQAGKGLVKGYIKAGTAVAMGAAGLGIGAVGGDLSDAFKGMAAGAAAGAYIGNNTGKRVVAAGEYINNARKGNNELGRFTQEVWEGKSAEEIEKQQYMSAYMDSKENRRRFLDKHSDIKNLPSRERENRIKEGMKKEAEMSYDTGITDYKTIREAVKLEESLAGSMGRERAHNLALTTAKLSEDYDKKTFTSRKNLKDAKDSFVDRLLTTPNSNLTEAQARAQADVVFNNMKKMKGL